MESSLNKRLDYIIKSNPNETFKISDEEKANELRNGGNFKARLKALATSNQKKFPLQYDAFGYLKKEFKKKRIADNETAMAQGNKPFLQGEYYENLYFLEKLQERYKQLNIEQSNNLKINLMEHTVPKQEDTKTIDFLNFGAKMVK